MAQAQTCSQAADSVLGWSYLGLWVGLEAIGALQQTSAVTGQSQHGCLIVIGWCFIAAQVAATHPLLAASGQLSLGTIAADWRRPPGGATSDARERQRWRQRCSRKHGPLVTVRDLRAPARGASRGEAPAGGCECPAIALFDGRAVTRAASSGGATSDTGARHQHRRYSRRNADWRPRQVCEGPRKGRVVICSQMDPPCYTWLDCA